MRPWRGLAVSTLVVLLGSTLAGACGSDEADQIRKAKVAEGCLINTDCNSPLVCAFRKCHVQCIDQRDCEPGELCVATDKPFKVCLFEEEQKCLFNTDCPEQMKCVYEKCRPDCKTKKDCVDGQECASGSCAVPEEVGPDGGLIAASDGGDASLGQSCVYDSDCPGTLLCKQGTCLPECQTIKDCPAGWACAQGTCSPPDAGTDGASGPSACQNGVQDPSETGVDCGGSCAACAGQPCTKPSDCASHVCTGQKCGAPSCSDLIQNGTESDVDCGGTACSKCPAPKGCWTNADCAENKCVGGSCVSPGCNDGTKSGNETDVDCGGPSCVPCPDEKACAGNGDCANGNCVKAVCKPPGPVTWVETVWTVDGDPRVAADPAGALVAAGGVNGTQVIGGVTLQSAGGWDLFVTKYTPAGAPVWARRLGGTLTDTLAGVAVDPSGDVLVAGITGGGGSFGPPLSCAGDGLFVVKLSGDKGAELWSRCFVVPSGSGGSITALATNASGDVYFAGRFHGTVDFGAAQLADTNWQGYLAKLSGVTGAPAWAKELTSTNSTPIRGLIAEGADVLAVGDFSNNLDLGGKQLTSTSANSDVVVARFAGASGTALDARRIGDAGIDAGHAISKKPGSGIVVAGAFASQVDFGKGPVASVGGLDGFLLELDAITFATGWVVTFGSAGEDRGISVSAKSNGEIALGARIAGAANFGGGPVVHTGASDFALARYSPAGTHLFSKGYGGLSNDEPNNLAWTTSALAFAARYSGSSIDLGTGALPGSKNGFFAHLVP